MHFDRSISKSQIRKLVESETISNFEPEFEQANSLTGSKDVQKVVVFLCVPALPFAGPVGVRARQVLLQMSQQSVESNNRRANLQTERLPLADFVGPITGR